MKLTNFDTNKDINVELETYPLDLKDLVGAFLMEIITTEGKLSLVLGAKELPMEVGQGTQFSIPQTPQAYAVLSTLLSFLSPAICTIAKHEGVDSINQIFKRCGYGLAFDIVDRDLLDWLDIRGLGIALVPRGEETVRDGGEGAASSES